MKRTRSNKRSDRPIYVQTPFGRAYFALLFAGILIVAALYWGLATVQGVPVFGGPFDPAKTAARLEVLKVSLTTTAGVAAIAGLYVAYRKQRNEEASIFREQDKVFTERFSVAAQLLESNKAAVRLAGLNALARLADDSPRDRSTCLATICAYLRLPIELPAGVDLDVLKNADWESLQRRSGWPTPDEWEVRRTGLSLVTKRLDRSRPDIYWVGAEVDLRNAVLIEPDLSNCDVDGVFDAAGALISGSPGVVWRNLSVTGRLGLVGAKFSCGLVLTECQFNGQTYFFDASIRNGMVWDRVEVSQHLSLAGIHADEIQFKRVNFQGFLSLNSAVVDKLLVIEDSNISKVHGSREWTFGTSYQGINFFDCEDLTVVGGITVSTTNTPEIVSLRNSDIYGPIALVANFVDLCGASIQDDPSPSTPIEFEPTSVLIDETSTVPIRLRQLSVDQPFPYVRDSDSRSYTRRPSTPSEGTEVEDTPV